MPAAPDSLRVKAMRRWFGILGAVALTAWAYAAAAASLEGVYSNVCLSRETGDQGGLEVEVRTGGAGPMVRFSICEGGCWTEATGAVSIVGDRIAFTTTEELFTEQRTLAESRVHHFTGRFVRGGLVLESSDRQGWARTVLKRQRWRGTGGPNGATPEDAEFGTPTPIRRCR